MVFFMEGPTFPVGRGNNRFVGSLFLIIFDWSPAPYFDGLTATILLAGHIAMRAPPSLLNLPKFPCDWLIDWKVFISWRILGQMAYSYSWPLSEQDKTVRVSYHSVNYLILVSGLYFGSLNPPFCSQPWRWSVLRSVCSLESSSTCSSRLDFCW